MATPAYVPLDPDKPSGPTQAPDAYSASDLANVRAMRDMLVSGLGLDGWTYTQSPPNTTTPNYYQLQGPAGRFFFAVMTYAAAPYFQPTTCQWLYTNDNGATQANVGPLVNFSFDALTGALHTASGMAGLFTQFIAARAYSVFLDANLRAHTSGAGGAVHGLGTMSTQNANAVNITGGTISSVGIQSPYIVGATRLTPTAPPTLASGAVWDWQGGGGIHFRIAPGATIANIANSSPGEIKRLYVAGAGAITIGGGGVGFAWATGHPVWGAASTIISCVAVDGGFVVGMTTPVG